MATANEQHAYLGLGLGENTRQRIIHNLKARMLVVQQQMEDFEASHCPQTLEFLHYRLDSLCRDISQHEYQAILPDGTIDLVVELYRLVSSQMESSELYRTDNNVHQGSAFSAHVFHSGNQGRPSYVITNDQLQFLADNEFTIKQMAQLLQVSPRTVQYRLQENNISIKRSYSQITDEELDERVEQILRNLPRAGMKTIQGYLRMQGIRVQRRRLRLSLYNNDPSRQVLRSLTAIRRRVYSVPSPLALWHIDGNHKLIRWRFVVHGGIDGYSRVIVFLKASSNNWAETVVDCFKMAISVWGLPSRVRADKGGENILVSEFMMTHPARGPNRGSFIQGRSVHNCRIERLWRDVYEGVLSSFYSLFNYMEDIGVLDPMDEIHLFCLHVIFLPRINTLLEIFSDVWNHHSVRTMNNLSPIQAYITGMHEIANENGLVAREYFEDMDEMSSLGYGIDLSDNLVSEQDESVTIPPIQAFITPDEEIQLVHRMGETQIDDLWNYDNYEQCVRTILDIIGSR